MAYVGIPAPVNKINIQTFTSDGTYTPTPGTTYAIIECVGGGGGGGGADTNTYSVGSGGGNGEYARGVFSASQIGASQSITVGAGGAGNSGLAGDNGGNTVVGSTLISANGGTGGGVLSIPSNDYYSLAGGAGGTGGTGGDFRFPGAQGGFATVFTPLGSSQYVIGGEGNQGYFTGGAPPVTILNGAATQVDDGNPATGYGGGGGGAVDYVVGTNQTGGAGSGGIVIITEFLSH